MRHRPSSRESFYLGNWTCLVRSAGHSVSVNFRRFGEFITKKRTFTVLISPKLRVWGAKYNLPLIACECFPSGRKLACLAWLAWPGLVALLCYQGTFFLPLNPHQSIDHLDVNLSPCPSSSLRRTCLSAQRFASAAGWLEQALSAPYVSVAPRGPSQSNPNPSRPTASRSQVRLNVASVGPSDNNSRAFHPRRAYDYRARLF